MSAPDALALSMLAVLTLSLCCLLTLVRTLVKNAGKSEEPLTFLEDEPETAPATWERDGDWWKS